MRPTEQIRSVLLSISTNKFRVFLTSLGIIIGTFTIIMVVGIGKASEAAVSEQYKRLSVETITISVNNQMRNPFSGNTRSLTKDDVLEMPNILDHVRSTGIMTSLSSTIAYGSSSKTVSVQGINEDYATISNLYLQEGDFFTDDDGKLRNRFVVLGYNVATSLFGDDVSDAIGEKVTIKGASFTVLGILQRIGGSGGVTAGAGRESSGSADDAVFIPYDVALKYTSGSVGVRGGGGGIMLSIAGGGGSQSYIALANDIQSVTPAIEEIKQYIAEVTGNPSSYTVTDAGSSLSSAMETSNTMSALLMAVAAIVLIVSGIGIMNVLMVAVKERTREIGILKSIGASRGVILSEFLLEAIFISVMGGLLGVLLSAYAPKLLSHTSISYLASIDGLVLGLGFSVLTGVFFGFYPAVVASKLKPIDALNSD